LAAKAEFRLEDEYVYNHSGAVRWVVSHMLRYPLLPLITAVCLVLNNLSFSYRQVIVGKGFDLIATGDWEMPALMSLVLALCGFALAQGITGVGRVVANETLASRIERDSRDELYVSLLGKSQTFHNRQRIGDVMARATNDVRNLNYMFAPGLVLITDSAAGVIVPFVLIAGISPKLLLVPAIFCVFLAVALIDYNRRLGPVSTARREQFGEMNAGLAETVSGIEVVKASAQERQAWHNFVQDARLFRDHFVKQGLIQARYWPMLVFIIANAFALLHGLMVWRGGSITLGEVVAFMGLFGTLRFPAFISIFTFDLVQLGFAGARRILELINAKTEFDENLAGVAQPIRGEVRFENVSFGYDGKLVLKDVGFVAYPGETIAIVGQTGSGKTTLTRLINRIFDVNSGRVLIDGVPVQEWNLESLRSQVSVIEQDVFLFSRSLAENIAFGCENAGREGIEEAARAAQAHDFIMSFSDGYETEVGERGVTLSGGQRQRIAIARAFLTDPRILILDDSTSAIDSATEDQIQRAMRRISSQRTTFLITHRLSQIRWADRILVMRRGELVDHGSHDELMARSEAYRSIFSHYE
jgi:ATP-binding cassette subfamily B protein